jgi:hypothetical protein
MTANIALTADTHHFELIVSLIAMGKKRRENQKKQIQRLEMELRNAKEKKQMDDRWA